MLSKDVAAKVLAEALQTGADLAEIYAEDVTTLRLSLEDGKLEQAERGADKGIGIRAFFGNLATYAYTDQLDEGSLLAAARAAAAAGKGQGQGHVVDLTERKSPLSFPVEKPFESLSIADKAALLHNMDETARRYSPLVSQVTARYQELRRQVWIYNSDGLYAEDDRFFTEMMGGWLPRKTARFSVYLKALAGVLGWNCLIATTR